ncbi:MAG: lactate racemase domain-containing protein, partial [Desulfitobacteriaceae bacterium]
MSLEQLLAPLQIPKMARIRQSFPRPTRPDIPQALRETLARPQILGRIKSGDRVAVTAGSRGIANIALIL